MQVNYKTISVLEFDVLTGTYKNVEKEVEDTSGSAIDNSFFELLTGANEGDEGKNSYSPSSESAFDLNEPLQASSITEPVNDNLTSNFYALRFRQDESLSRSQTQGEQLKSNLMSDLLATL